MRPHKAFYLVERTFIKGRSTRHAIHSGNDINFAEKGWSVVDMASPQERRLINMKSRINSATPPKPDETIFKLDAADGETLDQMINGKQPRASQGSIFQNRRKKEDKQKPRSLVQHDLSRVFNARDNSDQPSSAVRGFLELNPSICSGCGSSFQSKRVDAPGYLPPEKFHEHQEIAQVIRKQQDAVRILKMADIEYNSEAAEKMLKLSGYPEDIIAHVKTVDRESTDCDGEMTNQLMCICQRCFRLQQYGQVEHTLRPGWSSNQLLTPERFESLLSPIKDTKTVILCIVDVFDLQGSVVKNLKQIIGDNPLVIAVNKIDLLPKDISHIRVTNWVHSEIKRICGFTSPKFGHNVQFNEDDVAEAGVLRVSNVHLVSCQTNYGIRDVVKKVVSLASDFGNKVHVLGAANVGKSSFINRLLTPTPIPVMKTSGRKKVPLITVSNLPGTTLDFLRIKMPNGITVIDTPGLINKGHLTSKLTTDELKQVLPNKNITPVTLRLEAGKCVLMGGFAKIDVVEVKHVESAIYNLHSYLHSEYIGPTVLFHILRIE